MPDPTTDVSALDLPSLAPGRAHRLRLELAEDALGRPVRVPVIVLQGTAPGSTVALTAALHGNELNGIPVIHRLLRTIDPAALRGTIIAAPILNVPGYFAHTRGFRDGADLNRLMPGKAQGTESEVYAHTLAERLLPSLTHLVDLHTASFGRANTLYVRVDLTDPVAAAMARRVGAEIVLHNPGADGTLRGAAAARGIHAITVEIGDAQRLQKGLVKAGRIGLRDVIEHLGLVDPDHEEADRDAIECRGSAWLYTDRGGFLEVHADLGARVAAGELLATLTDEWGDVVCRYAAPTAGVVIGKATNPVAPAGARIVHLGVLA